MQNVRQMKIDLLNLNERLNNAINKMSNCTSAFEKAKRDETFFTLNMLPKYRLQKNRYYDPYNGTDVTDIIQKKLNKFTEDKNNNLQEKAEAEKEKDALEKQITQQVKDIKDAEIQNAIERKKNFEQAVNNAKQKLKSGAKLALRTYKKAGKEVLKGAQQDFKNIIKSARQDYQNYKLDKLNNLSFLDKFKDKLLNNGQTLKHSREVAKKGVHLIENESKLAPKSFLNEKGNKVVGYDHYDQFSHSVDLKLSKEYQQGTFGPQGLEIVKYKTLALKLNDDNKIDLSLPENQSILKNKEMLGEILEQYPEAFSTLPIQVIEKDSKFFASKFSNGVNNMVNKNNYGVDENGEEMDEGKYLDKMTQMGKHKREELQKLQQSRKNFQEEMGAH